MVIFISENLGIFHNLVTNITCMKAKKSKKLEEEKIGKEVEREQMLEQAHQLELQKNYEYDEKLDESTD
jgi:hypothetical protein